MTVWAVIFGNYYPREIDTLWSTKELADTRAKELGGMWEVEEMEVETEPRK